MVHAYLSIGWIGAAGSPFFSGNSDFQANVRRRRAGLIVAFPCLPGLPRPAQSLAAAGELPETSNGLRYLRDNRVGLANGGNLLSQTPNVPCDCAADPHHVILDNLHTKR